MESLLTGEGINPTQDNGKVIDLNRRREDQDPELKANIALYIQYWQSGNPDVQELFATGLKLAGRLLEKPTAPTRGKFKKKET
jgi:hypothetical protein